MAVSQVDESSAQNGDFRARHDSEAIMSTSMSANPPSPRPRRRLRPAEKATRQRAIGAVEPQRDNAEIPTPYILTHFTATRPRDTREAAERKKDFERQRAAARDIVKRLKHPTLTERLHYFWRSHIRESEQASSQYDPEKAEELDLGEPGQACRFYFKPRAEVPVMVCDFRKDSGERNIRTLGEIDRYMNSKPDDVVVRWIHVPIGVGILQSTIEELFNYGGCQEMGKPFTDSGMTGFPYPANVHSLVFYDQKYYEEQLDAWNVLSKVPLLRNGPGKDPLAGLSADQIGDLEWRSEFLRKEINFWDMTQADFPYFLSDRSIGDLNPRNRQLPEFISAHSLPAIATLREFRNSIMMISHFRAFHRSDGMLLTFAPQPGVEYLGQNFQDWIAPSNDVLLDPDASAVAHASATFLSSGTKKWHRKTVEWLTVYLLTEIVSTPNNHRQGNSAPSLTNGYHQIAVELKAKQKLPWQRGESVQLVRRYLSCLDELRVMQSMTDQKVELLRGLEKDVAKMEEEYRAERLEECNDDLVDSMHKRVEWALKQQETDVKDIKVLVDHMNTALDELFKLRSIEQNELAIAADSQNKAILVFTGVTVIFLPLSFFTSYFGMNLTDLDPQDNGMNQGFFWKTCGTLGFSMVLLVVLYAFRSSVMRLYKNRVVRLFGPIGSPLPM